MTAADLLVRYVLLHNYGVESGDFEPLMLLFRDDAIFEFEDPRIGVFEGLDMIRGVFRRQGPTVSIAVGNIVDEGRTARADYSSALEPDKRLGFISAEMEGDEIRRLFIGK